MIIVPPEDIDSEGLEDLEKLIADLGLPVRRVGCASRPLLASPGAVPGKLLIRQLKATGMVERLIPISSELGPIDLMTRRSFLDYVVSGALITGAGAAGFSLFAFARPPRRGVGSTDEVVIRKSRLTGTSAVTFHMGKDLGILVKDQDRYFALSAICTHKNTCQVSWSPERRELFCPCHNGAFDLQGNVLDGPPPRPLRRYRVALVRDTLYVRR